MISDIDLIDRLAGGLTPARPQRRAAGWIQLAVASASTLAILGATSSFRGDLAHPPASAIWFVVVEIALFVLGLICAIATIAMASPLKAGRPGAFWALVMAGVLPLSALGWLVLVRGFNGILGRLLDWDCAAKGTLTMVLVAASLLFWLRRGAPSSPRRAGLYLGFAAGGLGSAFYGLTCPLDGPAHWMIWHFAPVAIGGILGRVLVPPLIRW